MTKEEKELQEQAKAVLKQMKGEKKIPISQCRRCVYHNGYMCILDDLHPCIFKAKMSKLEYFKLWLMKKLSNTK